MGLINLCVDFLDLLISKNLPLPDEYIPTCSMDITLVWYEYTFSIDICPYGICLIEEGVSITGYVHGEIPERLFNETQKRSHP
jgi:hypothetical protein